MDVNISPQFVKLVLKTLQKALSPESNKGNVAPAPQHQVNLPKFNLKSQFQQANQQLINTQLLLNRPQQSVIIKDLMQLPQDLKTLLAQLQTDSPKITPEVIKQLLETNSKEVISKLLKLIQQSPNNPQNHEQLKQLISLMNHAVPARNASPQEAITHLLLLYLPWLPLVDPQKVETWFEKKGSKSKESEDDSVAMVIYISTINFGRFKVIIFADKDNTLDILIQNIDSKEKEPLKKILKAIKTEIKKEKITAETHMSVVTQKNFNKSDKTDVTIAQVNNLSPNVLITAQKIIRIILEFDEKQE